MPRNPRAIPAASPAAGMARVVAGWLAFFLVALAVLVGAASPASAHPYFLNSTPAPDSISKTSPTEIDITYTEALDYPYSKVVLIGPDQRVTDTHQVHPSGPSTLAVVPNRPLSTLGTYEVGWTAVGQDGHTVTGSFSISVGHQSPGLDVTDTVASLEGSAGGEGRLVDVLRTVMPVFTVVLAGMLLLTPVIATAVAGAGAGVGADGSGPSGNGAGILGNGDGAPVSEAPLDGAGLPGDVGAAGISDDRETGGVPGSAALAGAVAERALSGAVALADAPSVVPEVAVASLGVPEGAGAPLVAPDVAVAAVARTGDRAGNRRALVVRRVAWLLIGSWVGLAAVVVALSAKAINSGGLGPFIASSSGRRLMFQLALIVAAQPLVFDRGSLRDGARPPRLRQVWGWLVALGLLIALAVSGHASSQPTSRRDVAIGVYSLHILAVAVWAGALVAVLLPLGRRHPMGAHVARLRPLVSVAIGAVIVTGFADTDWGIRSLAEVGDTAYGRLVVAKFVLYVAMIALGLVATFGFLRSRPRIRGRLMLTEAAIGVVVLILAGTLSQVPQPIDLPYVSQVFASTSGLPLSVGASGGDLVVGAVSPGLIGANRIIVQVDGSDINDFLYPEAGIQGITALVTCGCGHDVGLVTLHQVPGSAWWVAPVTLAVAANWSVETTVQYAQGFGPKQPSPGAPLEQAQLTAQILPSHIKDQVIVAVPADLSGPLGAQCQDQALGLQVALEDVNAQARDHGRLVRVVSVDIHNGVGPAMARIHALRPVAVALPCGAPAAVDAAIAQARAWKIPVLADQAPTTAESGVWALGPDWSSEGRLIADQVHQQGATNVEVLAGSTAVDKEELAGTTAELTRLGLIYGVTSIPANPTEYVSRLEAVDPASMIIIANPTEVLPTITALSNANLADGWRPARGTVVSSQLMNTDFINAAGQDTRLGVLEIASDVNPFDPIDQYYAQRLRTLIPGIRPTFDGVHGYIAGWLLATALRDGGGAPSPSRLATIFATKFTQFGLGSYQAQWNRSGGNASELSFFLTTYINPLAMPSNTPGGSQSMTHEGTFLDTGGFEQVAPFVKVAGA